MNTKQNEIKYISNLNAKEKKWVQSKPFGNYNIHESFLRIRDFSYILELLSLDGSKNLSLLDLGCGSGWTSIMLSKFCLNVTGVDIAQDMIAIAKKNAKKENQKINFIVSDIEKINFKNQFDRVLSYDALHHCPNELKVLKESYNALKPGGIILIVEPNKKHGVAKDSQKIAARFGVLEKGYSPAYLKKEMKKIGYKNIVQYHCDYTINRPMGNDAKSFIKQILRLIVTRLVFSHNITQVWLKAEK